MKSIAQLKLNSVALRESLLMAEQELFDEIIAQNEEKTGIRVGDLVLTSDGRRAQIIGAEADTETYDVTYVFSTIKEDGSLNTKVRRAATVTKISNSN